MANCVNIPYNTKNEYFIKLHNLLKNVKIDVWQPINKTTYIYKNKQNYFHICIIKKGLNLFYIDDFILQKDFNQKYIKSYGDFNQEKLISFLKQKSNINN